MFSGGVVYISDMEHNRKLKFSMQTHMTTLYLNVAMLWCDVDVLYLEDGNAHRPFFKTKPQLWFLIKNRFYF